jgi:hypothetical protein
MNTLTHRILAPMLLSAAIVAATAVSMQMSVRAAGTEGDCTAHAEGHATPLVDDGSSLDVTDPQFAEKLAQRYQRWGRAAP